MLYTEYRQISRKKHTVFVPEFKWVDKALLRRGAGGLKAELVLVTPTMQYSV
jgi:hypothetical protein